LILGVFCAFLRLRRVESGLSWHLDRLPVNQQSVDLYCYVTAHV
jgi:hypothetical protein